MATLGRILAGGRRSDVPGKIRKIVADDTASLDPRPAGDATNTAVALRRLRLSRVVDWRMSAILLAVQLFILTLVMSSDVPGGLRGLTEGPPKPGALSAANRLNGGGHQGNQNFKVRTRRTPVSRKRASIFFRPFPFLLDREVRQAGIGIPQLLLPAGGQATVAPIAVWFVDAGWIDAVHTLPFFMVGLGNTGRLVQLVQMVQHLLRGPPGSVAGHQAVLDSDARGRGIRAEGPNAGDKGLAWKAERRARRSRGRPEAGSSVRLTDVVFGYDPENSIIRGVFRGARRFGRDASRRPVGRGKTTSCPTGRPVLLIDVGSVAIDGSDVSSVVAFAWRSVQDVALIHDTVAANIASARPPTPRAGADEEAARAAQTTTDSQAS